MDPIWALLIPLIVVEVGLALAALWDLTRPTRRVRGGNKVVWAMVIIAIRLVGPMLYFLVGREPD